MVVLTKADIINGKENIQEVEFPQLKGSLNLRPLTDGEYHEISTMIKNGGLGKLNTKPVMDGAGGVDKEATLNSIEIDIDVEKIEKVKYQAARKAVAYSLSNSKNGEKWTEEDVKAFPADSVEPIAMKVFEITGVENPEKTRKDMEDFRESEP